MSAADCYTGGQGPGPSILHGLPGAYRCRRCPAGVGPPVCVAGVGPPVCVAGVGPPVCVAGVGPPVCVAGVGPPVCVAGVGPPVCVAGVGPPVCVAGVGPPVCVAGVGPPVCVAGVGPPVCVNGFICAWCLMLCDAPGSKELPPIPPAQPPSTAAAEIREIAAINLRILMFAFQPGGAPGSETLVRLY